MIDIVEGSMGRGWEIVLSYRFFYFVLMFKIDAEPFLEYAFYS